MVLAALPSSFVWGQPQPQEISFNPPAEVEVGTVVELDATSSAGLTVTYTIDDGASAPPAGGDYFIFTNFLQGISTAATEPGVVVIDADQSGTEAIAVAATVTRSISFQYPVVINYQVDESSSFADEGFAIEFFPKLSALASGFTPVVATADSPLATDVTLTVDFGDASVENNILYVQGSGLVSVSASYVETTTDLYLTAQTSFLIDLGDLISQNNNLDNWTWSNPSVDNTSEVLGFADDGSTVVAVGRSGLVRTSSNGINWTDRNSGVTTDIEGITYASGLGLFVAVGESGTILTSPNGITWTQRSSPSGFSSRLRDVVFAESRLVAVGDNGSLLTSANALSWTDRSLSVDGNDLNSIAYGEGIFVAVGDDLTVATADNPEAGWTITTVGVSDSFTRNSLNDMLYDGEDFIAVGEEGTLLQSSDGVFWEVQFASRAKGLNTVAEENGTIIVLGETGDAVVSLDKQFWEEGSTGFVYDIQEAHYFNRQFIAGGSNGVILTSSSGVAWTVRDADIRDSVNGSAFNGSIHLAVGDNGRLFRSSDGASWVSSTLGGGFTEDLYGVVYHESQDQFVVVGEGGSVFTSNNGTVWTRRIVSGLGDLRSVTYSSSLDLLVAVGDDFSIATSSNGATWIVRSSGAGNDLQSVAAGSDGLVAVGDNGRIIFSDDGINWDVQVSFTTDYLYSVAFGRGRFVVVGEDGVALLSDSGTTWVRQETGVREDIHSVIYSGNTFVAVGVGFSFLSSEDGVSWTALASGGATGLNFVSSDNDLLVAVGEYGIILTSSVGIVSGLDDWEAQIPEITGTDLNEVIVGRGVIVAVGDEGLILVSSDGISWQTVESGTTSNLNAITYGNGTFLVVGERDILYSTDGLDWEQNTIWFAGLQDVVYGDPGGVPTFVAVGLGGGALVSNDGRNWASASTPAFEGPDFFAATFYNGIFMIGGSATEFKQQNENTTTIGTSTDGRSFVRRIPPRRGDGFVTDTIKEIAAGNGVFMLVGENMIFRNRDRYAEANSFPVTDVQSVDISTGSLVLETIFTSIQRGFPYEGVAYGEPDGEPAFTIVGRDGAILRITDGILGATETRFSQSSDDLSGVTFSEYGFIGVGDSGRVLQSQAGRDWRVYNAALADPFNAIIFGEEYIVSAGNNGQLLTSGDGLNWLLRDPGVSVDLNSGVFGTGKVVVVGDSGSVFFSDSDVAAAKFGESWASAFTPTVKDLYAATVSGGEYVAVGDSGTILSSANGESWISVLSPTLTPLRDVVPVGNNRFLAVGDSGVVVRENELGDWELLASGLSADISAVAFDGTTIVAVGESGFVVRSTDLGSTWQIVDSEVEVDLVDVSFANNVFIATGRDGVLLSSSSGTSWTPRYTGTNQLIRSADFRNGLYAFVGGFGEVRTSGNFIPAEAQSISFEPFAAVRLGEQWVPLVARSSSGLPVSFSVSDDSIARLTGEFNEFVTPLQEGTFIVTASQQGDAAFKAADSVTATITVLKQAQSIVFDEIPDQPFSPNTIVLSAKASGGSTVLFEVLEGDATIEGNRLTLQGAGSVQVRAFTAATADFSESEEIQIFNVERAEQSITFDEVFANDFVGQQVELSALASSGLPVTLALTSGPGSLEDNILTALDEGAIIVTASQEGDDDFLPAAEVERTIQVGVEVINRGWRERDFPVDEGILSIASNGDDVVAATSSGTLYFQANAGEWSQVLNAGTRIHQVAYLNNGWIAVGLFRAIGSGSYRSIYTSTDGVTWEARFTNFSSPLLCVEYFKGAYYIGSVFGKVYRSTDLDSFEEISLQQLSKVNDLFVGGGRLFALGDGGNLQASSDGQSWSPQSVATSSSLSAGVSSGDKAVIATVSGELFLSEDFRTWRRVFRDSLLVINSVSYGANRFLAVGTKGTILFSQLGEAWSRQLSKTDQALFNVTISETYSFVGGALGTVLRSTNPVAQSVPNSFIAQRAAPMRSGWFQLEWFGLFNDTFSPWIYNAELGWIHIAERSTSGFWIYFPESGWAWTDSGSYPYVYNSSVNAWEFVGEATAVGYWVYSFQDASWRFVTK